MLFEHEKHHEWKPRPLVAICIYHGSKQQLICKNLKLPMAQVSTDVKLSQGRSTRKLQAV